MTPKDPEKKPRQGIFSFLKADTKAKVAISLLLGLAIMISVQLLSRRGIKDLVVANNQMVESFQAAKLLEGFKVAVVSFENVVRGYFITGDSTYIQNLNAGIVTAQTYLSDLKKELDQEEFSKDLQTLDHLLHAKVIFSQHVIEAYNEGGQGKAQALYDTQLGKTLQDSIELVADNLLIIEDQQIGQSILENETQARRVLRLQSTGNILVGLITALAIFFLFRDLKKRDNLLNALHKAKEEAEHNKLLEEQFMANMSHEIRTPLNAILGFSNLLSRTHLSPKQVEFTNTIRQSSENLLVIVNDILDFSKIEEGMMHLENIPFRVRDIAHALERMFLPRIEEKGINLFIKVGNDVPDFMQGDPTRLLQILANLTNNAMKFTEEGKITIDIRVVQELGTRLFLEIVVRDTGIGIPKEKMNEIFLRFHQAEADTTRRYGGTGLGLSIVKRLVELQGGSIKADSKEGEGTSFTVVLPFQIVTAPPAEASGPHVPKPLISTASGASQVRLLIAEDNLLNQRLLQLLLAEWGITFEIVPNGIEALAALRRQPFDLVLMDIQMPEMDGYTATALIRQEWGGSIPVIAMTAHAMASEREKCLSYGMNDFLSKPIQENDLHDMIARWAPRAEEISLSPPGKKMVNLNYLVEMSKGKTAFIREMAELFLQQAPKEMATMEEALASEDLDQLRRSAHSMKSTAGFMGLAASVGEPLHELEEAAAARRLEESRELFLRIKPLVHAALAEVEQDVLKRFI